MGKKNVNSYKRVEALAGNNENSAENEDKEKVEEEKSDKEEKINILDNSGYSSLEEDINADDASEIISKTMYK